jgi:tetratricopeptide (TPR) repeat protein
MKLVRMTMIAVAVLCWTGISMADEIVMKNGQKWIGKIMRETDTEITIAIELNGGAKAGVTVKKEDTEKIVRCKLPSDEYAEKLADVKAIKDAAKSVQAYVELARWARGNKLLAEAWQCYDGAVSADPAQADTIQIEKAEAAIESGAMTVAEKTLKDIAARNPKHPRLEGLVQRTTDGVKDDIETDLKTVLERYMRSEFPRALAGFVQMTRLYDAAKLEEMSKECEKQTGQSLAALMVDCRFRQKCAPCKGKGTIPCANPNCEFGRKKVYHRPVETDQKGTNAGATSTTEYCAPCKGLGENVCKKCEGTGQDFGTPTEYEKKKFVEVLASMGGGVLSDAAKLMEFTKSKDCDEEVRFANALTMFLDLRRAGFYLEKAKEYAPMLNLQLFRQLNQLNDGAAQLLYNGAIRKYAAAKALLPTGSIYTLYDVLILAEDARASLMTADATSPIGAAPLFGNTQRELRNVEGLLADVRKAISMIERGKNVRLTERGLIPITPGDPGKGGVQTEKLPAGSGGE